MVYSKTKLKSNGDKAFPCFQTILNRKVIRHIFTYVDLTVLI